jgi:hypothetical protein
MSSTIRLTTELAHEEAPGPADRGSHTSGVPALDDGRRSYGGFVWTAGPAAGGGEHRGMKIGQRLTALNVSRSGLLPEWLLLNHVSRHLRRLPCTYCAASTGTIHAENG